MTGIEGFDCDLSIRMSSWFVDTSRTDNSIWFTIESIESIESIAVSGSKVILHLEGARLAQADQC